MESIDLFTTWAQYTFVRLGHMSVRPDIKHSGTVSSQSGLILRNKDYAPTILVPSAAINWGAVIRVLRIPRFNCGYIGVDRKALGSIGVHKHAFISNVT